MISFNQVTFAGNVGKESEVHTTETGKTYTRFSLAVDSFAKDEAPMWLTVTAWGKLAEQVSKLVKKGSLVLVSGRLAVRTYSDKEGKERTSVDVIAHTVEVLPRPEKANSQVTEPDEAQAA